MLARLILQVLGRRREPLEDFASAYRLYQSGRFDEADRACESLASAGRTPGDIHYLRALIAEQRRDFTQATAFCQLAVEAKPGEPLFRLSLGKFLLDLDRRLEAAEQFAIAWDKLPPGNEARLRAATGAAQALAHGGDPASVGMWCERALEIEPGHAGALEQLAFSFHNTGDTEAARRALDAVPPDRLQTGVRIRRAVMGLPIILDSQAQIEEVRRRYEDDLDELLATRLAPLANPVSDIGLTPFYLAFHGCNDRSLMEKLGRVCRAVLPPAGEHPRLRRRQKLRIAFVSTFFFSHSIGRLNLGLVQDLPREHFEVQVFSVAPPLDAIAKAFSTSADFAVNLPARLEDVRAAIQAAEPDILFFPDIGMHPLTYFLAFHRLAPVQILTWGHPVTSGIDTLDWFLSAEALEAAETQSHYSERLMKLRGFFWPAYGKPSLSAPARTRSHYALPEGLLYACLQSTFKLNPSFDAALREILERQPGAHLLLLESSTPAWQARLRTRMDRALGAAASRVRFMPRVSHQDYLQYVAQADVILDPFEFGGGNTSCEALALGKPVVTLPAPYLRGRFTRGMYREMDMDACTADSVGDYVSIAVKLGTEPEFRRAVSRQIEDRSHVLFDRRDVVLEFSQRLREVCS